MKEPEEPGRFQDEEREHGYAPGVGTASEETRRSGDRAFDRPSPEPERPGREPSDEEREGVPATDTEARSPLGVGTSETRRGERIAAEEPQAGRVPKGTKGRTERPYGTSAPEHGTGVEPSETAEEESPHLPPGDQAG